MLPPTWQTVRDFWKATMHGCVGCVICRVGSVCAESTRAVNGVMKFRNEETVHEVHEC